MPRPCWGGIITNLGNHYVIGLNAVDCASGDTLVEEQLEASGKEDVLKALGNAATNIRGRLGESLASVQRFDTPIEEATTSSLEALKAYTMGRGLRGPKEMPPAFLFTKKLWKSIPRSPSPSVPWPPSITTLGRRRCRI